MTLYEKLQDAREEGREEGLAEGRSQREALMEENRELKEQLHALQAMLEKIDKQTNHGA